MRTKLSRKAADVAATIHKACGTSALNRETPWYNAIRQVLLDVFGTLLDEDLPADLDAVLEVKEEEEPKPRGGVPDEDDELLATPPSIEDGAVEEPKYAHERIAAIKPQLDTGDLVGVQCPDYEDVLCEECANVAGRDDVKFTIVGMVEHEETGALMYQLYSGSTGIRLRCPGKYLKLVRKQISEDELGEGEQPDSAYEEEGAITGFTPPERRSIRIDQTTMDFRNPAISLHELLGLHWDFDTWLGNAGNGCLHDLGNYLDDAAIRYLIVLVDKRDGDVSFRGTEGRGDAEQEIEDAMEDGSLSQAVLGVFDLDALESLQIEVSLR